MMTQKLEELIHEGRAKYASYSIGGSGVGTIPFPDGARGMVVIDILWSPFNDHDIVEDANNFTTTSIHTLQLYNGKEKSTWNFRDYIGTSQSNDARLLPMFQSPTQVNTYFVSKEYIRVNIFKFSLTATNFDAIPLTSQELETPNGYGTLQAVRSLNGTFAQISSLGLLRDPNGVAVNDRNRNEFFDDINVSNALIRPNSADQYLFPLVTFGVVYLFDRVVGQFP